VVCFSKRLDKAAVNSKSYEVKTFYKKMKGSKSKFWKKTFFNVSPVGNSNFAISIGIEPTV
jgi:hypothetical protein